MKIKIIKLVLAVIVIVTGIIWFIFWGIDNASDNGSTYVINNEETDSDAYTLSESYNTGSQQEVTSEPVYTYIVIYVCGEVRSPGVYKLMTGDRVTAAIEAAGGFSEAAATDYLNLARVLQDGEMIDVPSLDEVKNGIVREHEDYYYADGDSTKTLSVNINTATKEELMELPGIGESRAISIIKHRENKGQFAVIEDIMLVSGIKEAAFEKIKDYIRVR
ncbi:MAG: helix-hairpin-helix domain-containing protein [Lachnospiraceae bacterium]|nr:helix-hairpin-helix domain-containing protein [Lachnospiraceae bacterium]